MPSSFRFASRKYGGAVHRTWSAHGPLREEGFLLFGYRQAEMVYPASGRHVRFDAPALHLVRPSIGQLATLWFGAAGDLEGVYVDICLPPRVDMERRRVEFLDLDLDVRALPAAEGMLAEELDRAEFLAHRRSTHYPLALAAFAQASLRRTLRDLREDRLFGRTAQEWHARLQALLTAAGA